MNAHLAKIFTGIIIALGSIGLVFMILNQPLRLLRYFIVSAIIIGVFILLMKNIRFSNQGVKKEQKEFIKAARQSRRRIKKRTKKVDLKKKQALKKRYSSGTHLTVIEGKKGKKKNRAIH